MARLGADCLRVFAHASGWVCVCVQTNASQKEKADAKIGQERREQEQLVMKQKQLREELERIKIEKEHIAQKLERSTWLLFVLRVAANAR